MVNARPSRLLLYCFSRCLAVRDRNVCILHNHLGQFIKKKKTEMLKKKEIGFRGINTTMLINSDISSVLKNVINDLNIKY